MDRVVVDNAFFEKLLRSGLHDDSIRNVEIIDREPASQVGQNFLSNVTRFTLKYTCVKSENELSESIQKISHLIMKEELSEGEWVKEIQKMSVFTNESSMLKEELPEIEKLVGQKIGPKFMYGCNRPGVIIMEDLGVLGFKTKKRTEGFSKSHMVMVIEALAKFHAGSVALDEAEPTRFHHYNQKIPNEIHKNLYKMVQNCILHLSQVVCTWSDEKCARTAAKIEKFGKNVVGKFCEAIKYDKNEFCVLNHGDCWINNIMFRENEEGEPLEVRLIDYQMSLWSSPAIDLLYLLSTCPAFNIKCDLDDFFLETYLQILTENIQRLNCKKKPPTIDDIKQSMLKRKCLAITFGLVFYPKIIVDHSRTFQDILEKELWGENVYDNPEVVEKLKKIIPVMDKRGFFD